GMRGLRRSWTMPAEITRPAVPADRAAANSTSVVQKGGAPKAAAPGAATGAPIPEASIAGAATTASTTARAVTAGVAPDGISRGQRVRGLLVGVPVSLLWAFPVLILVATAFHNQKEAGLAGWWQAAGLGLGSFKEASSAGLWQALFITLLVAGLA